MEETPAWKLVVVQCGENRADQTRMWYGIQIRSSQEGNAPGGAGKWVERHVAR